MSTDIQIIEKPEWISWDDIKQCLEESHSVNRERGINMIKYRWTVEKIRESMGINGVMLVAIDGKKVVGTAALGERERETWYVKGRYAYMSLACVLPQYSGCGIYKKLLSRREEIAKSRDYSVFLLDTHEKNTKIQNIAKSAGYQCVSYFNVTDHYNVIMAKWPAGCPYSETYCKFRVCLSWINSRIKKLLWPLYRIVKK